MPVNKQKKWKQFEWKLLLDFQGSGGQEAEKIFAKGHPVDVMLFSLRFIFLDPPQFSGRSLPVVSWGRHRSVLAGAGPRAEERWHQQTAVGVRQHAVCVRDSASDLLSLYVTVALLTSSTELLLHVFQEVERRWSSNPQSVCELVSGSSVACYGDHGDVWSSCFPLRLDSSFTTDFIPSSSTWTLQVWQVVTVTTGSLTRVMKLFVLRRKICLLQWNQGAGASTVVGVFLFKCPLLKQKAAVTWQSRHRSAAFGLKQWIDQIIKSN